MSCFVLVSWTIDLNLVLKTNLKLIDYLPVGKGINFKVQFQHELNVSNFKQFVIFHLFITSQKVLNWWELNTIVFNIYIWINNHDWVSLFFLIFLEEYYIYFKVNNELEFVVSISSLSWTCRKVLYTSSSTILVSMMVYCCHLPLLDKHF